MGYFLLFIGFVIALRLTELVVAKRNEKWAFQNGGIEYGKSHYKYIVMLHTLFIVSMLAEYWFRRGEYKPEFLIIFIWLIAFKVWTISSLGKYWNTKIIRIPDSKFIRNGPYRYFKHPNYFIVVCEIIVIPMVFNLYLTAIIFTLLNAVMLTVRIRVEEKVWAPIK